MIRFAPGSLGRVLAIGAHSDAIEIGCGGTLLALADAHPDTAFVWVVMTGTGDRAVEARASSEAFFGAGRHPILELAGLADGRLPFSAEAKEFLADVGRRHDADLVLTHHRADLHQDHRHCAELALQTFRGVLILEYEIPKYDGDMGRPNLYQPLTSDQSARKLDHLDAHFGSQRGKPWYDRGLFEGLMRLRGMETGVADHAEAFYGRKLVLKGG